MGDKVDLPQEGTLQCLNRSDCASSHPQDLEQPPNEDANLLPQLQQLESTLSSCTKEASKDQVFVRMGYMASELKRLASKVHKNEQRTSFLQVSEG